MSVSFSAYTIRMRSLLFSVLIPLSLSLLLHQLRYSSSRQAVRAYLLDRAHLAVEKSQNSKGAS